jgi:multidrug efflux system membrane fusion protein
VLPNADHALTPGLFARVQFGAGSQDAAMLIDDKAVLTDQDRKYVYVLGPDNKAQRKDIVPGRMVDGLRVVSSGLEVNDKVIVSGLQKVFFPGMPVQPKTVAMDGNAADAAASAAPVAMK